MSENLTNNSVVEEISYLASLADVPCSEFQEYVLNSKTTWAAINTELFVITYNIPGNSSFVVTAIDCKSLIDPTVAIFVGGDFRSTDDINPWGPLTAGSDVAQVRILANGENQFNPAWDIGVINQSMMMVFGGNIQLQIGVTPNNPAGTSLVLVTRVRGYMVSAQVGDILKKKETRILTLPNVP